jgi:nitrilase
MMKPMGEVEGESAMENKTLHRVAVVQHPPVFLNRAATIERAITLIDEAADHEAQIIVFSETFIPGYPTWIGRVRYRDDNRLVEELHARLVANSINLEQDDLRALRMAARRRAVTVVCGIQERDGVYSRGTLYNAVVVIGPTGDILNRHRKLVPTGVERGVWGQGDGSGLRVVDTPAGRIGTLICFENHMPLARFSLYAQGVNLYIAPTVAYGDLWLSAMRHIAIEGGCWVISCGTALHARDIAATFPERDNLFGDVWLHDGDSVVVNPSGTLVAGPLHQEHGILYAECTPDQTVAMRRRIDVAGHYGRPDIFHLVVNRVPLAPVRFRDDSDEEQRSLRAATREGIESVPSKPLGIKRVINEARSEH